jgi:hypothetical protein
MYFFRTFKKSTAPYKVHNMGLRYIHINLKGSQRMGGGQIFLKTFRASLFTEDLSDEPNFSRIHIAGQYI